MGLPTQCGYTLKDCGEWGNYLDFFHAFYYLQSNELYVILGKLGWFLNTIEQDHMRFKKKVIAKLPQSLFLNKFINKMGTKETGLMYPNGKTTGSLFFCF